MSRLVGDDGKLVTQLLWGDPVAPTGRERSDGWVEARGRTRTGWIDPADLSDSSEILELYVIDVGQGDAVLFRTPDDRWHLIDGGKRAACQMTKKGVLNFLRWKFLDDLGRPAVDLESVILSHPDSDHYGGLIDLCEGKLPLRDGTIPVRIGSFYHSGLGDYPPSALAAALVDDEANVGTGDPAIAGAGRFLARLIDDAASLSAPPVEYASTFETFATLISSIAGRVQRLDRGVGHLPGYESGSSAVEITVLGPIVESLAHHGAGLRYLDSGDGASAAKTKNGHSVVLRLDYRQVRVLLTGDLNEECQPLLLHYAGAAAFTADVAKACHHGSDQVDPRFIAAIAPRVTIVSSGDNETYSHPRPALLGLSGKMGRMSAGPGRGQVPPLVYSTEVSRSVELAFVDRVQLVGDDAARKTGPSKTLVSVKAWREPKAPGRDQRPLTEVPVAANLVYGLVNVRTDGREILCATMNESGNTFDVRVLRPCP